MAINLQGDRLRKDLGVAQPGVPADVTGLRESMDVRFQKVDGQLQRPPRRHGPALRRGRPQRVRAIDQRFDAVDQRFDGVDQRFDGVDQRLDTLDAKLDTILSELRKPTD